MHGGKAFNAKKNIRIYKAERVRGEGWPEAEAEAEQSLKSVHVGRLSEAQIVFSFFYHAAVCGCFFIPPRPLLIRDGQGYLPVIL